MPKPSPARRDGLRQYPAPALPIPLTPIRWKSPMSHAPETYGLAAFAYLRALAAELREAEPGLHARALERAIASFGDTPRLGDRPIIQALKELG